MATYLANLENARDSLAAQLAIETAHCQAHGPKPTYSLDGESYSWAEWREAITRTIENLNRLIQGAKPYMVLSKGRI